MNQRRHELALRRERLLARSEQVRRDLTVQAVALQPVLALGDRARVALQWVRRHPGIVFTATIVIVVARPRFVWRWGLRVWSAVRFFRTLRSNLGGLGLH